MLKNMIKFIKFLSLPTLLICVFSGCGSNDISTNDKFVGFWVSDTIAYNKFGESELYRYEATHAWQARSLEEMPCDLSGTKYIGIIEISKKDGKYFIKFANDKMAEIFDRTDKKSYMQQANEKRVWHKDNWDVGFDRRAKPGKPEAMLDGNTLKIKDGVVTQVKINDDPWKDLMISVDLTYDENTNMLILSNYEEKLGNYLVPEEDSFMGYQFIKAKFFKKYSQEDYTNLKNTIWNKLVEMISKGATPNN